MGACLGDAGYKQGEDLRADGFTKATQIRTAAAILVAIANAKQLVDAYRQVKKIKRRAAALAERERAWLKELYWPHEIEFLKEAFSDNDPDLKETLEESSKRIASRLKADIARVYAEKQRQLQCGAPKYCTSAKNKMMQDFFLEKSKAMANAELLASNMAFAEFQAKTDLNLDRRLKAVALGQGLVGQAASLYSRASQLYGNVLAGAAQTFNSSLQAVGYSIVGGGLAKPSHVDTMIAAGGNPFQPLNMPSPAVYAQGGRGGNSSGGAVIAGGSIANASDSEHDASNVASRSLANTLTSPPAQALALGHFGKPTHISKTAESGNEGTVGNKSLARYGKYLFQTIDTDTHGKPLHVMVDMSKFQLLYTDNETPGTTGS